MNSDRGHILRAFVAILLFVGLANISSCKWGSWDLFGGDPVNQDGSGGDGDSGGNNGDGSSTDFPPAVFTANIGGTKINEPVELFSSFSNGSDIIELTGVINVGGSGTDFKVSPDGTLVAYLFQKSNGNFELRVVPVEGGAVIRISQALSDDSDVVEFNWSPDGFRIAYLADDVIDGRFELYTNLSQGGDNVKVSGDLPPGGRVQAFEWAPDSSLIAYTADQNILGEFELFSTPDTEADPARVSRQILPNDGDVTEFGWSPGSIRIAYLSDQRSSGEFELFITNLRAGGGNVQISGGGVNVLEFAWAPDLANESIAYSTERAIFTASPEEADSGIQVTPALPIDGSIADFAWAPNSSRIAYRADQDFFGDIELFTVRPDSSNNIQISGALVTGGDVTDFVWSPDSNFIAYRANQDSVLIFELYVATPDVSESDTKVSGDMILTGSVEPIFSWSPDSARVAYRANQITANAIELFTSTPDGQTNDRVSGDLFSGGDVLEFKWAPDNSGIGYIADQESDEFFELFASTPDGGDTAILSGSFAEAGDVLFFEWVPESAEPDPNNP